MAAEIDIRVLSDLADFQKTLDVQAEVWGFSEIERVPSRLSVVFTKIGGLVLGAFEHGEMVGFSLAFPGILSGGRPYWHSHMTGVLPTHQNRRIGRALKLRQREEALRSGVELIEWTFDPLEIRNAYFNIERLGVVCGTFLPNYYGLTSSRLHGGLPTDRLLAEWRVVGERAIQAVADRRPPRPRIAATVEVPAKIDELRRDDPEQARAVQTGVREAFQRYFAQGKKVVGFRVSAEAGVFELSDGSEP